MFAAFRVARQGWRGLFVEIIHLRQILGADFMARVTAVGHDVHFFHSVIESIYYKFLYFLFIFQIAPSFIFLTHHHLSKTACPTSIASQIKVNQLNILRCYIFIHVFDANTMKTQPFLANNK